MGISSIIQEKLKTLSSRPGVYLMRDRLGKVIYVGKAKALNKRVRSYFQSSRFHQLDPKTRALVEMVADLEIHEVKNETEAILLEGKLIKQYKPKYNISFRDDKRFLLVKLKRKYRNFLLPCRPFGYAQFAQTGCIWVMFDSNVAAHALILSVHITLKNWAISMLKIRSGHRLDTLFGEGRMEKGFSIAGQFFVG